MPSLLVFVACERVALDQRNNGITLIGLLQGFIVTKIEPAEPVEIPLDGTATAISDLNALPIWWCAFGLWRKMAEDQGKKYTQIAEVIAPNGKVLSSTKPTEFVMDHEYHRITHHFHGFPISESGDYIVRILCGESGAELSEKARYPIGLSINKPKDSRAVLSLL